MNIPQHITDNLSTDRFRQIELNKFFLDELSILTDKNVNRYYKHIIEKVKIDKSNPNNSYIMWAVDKVDTINKNKPCNISSSKSSLPDVDVDIPRFARQSVIQYLKDEYNSENVGQMLTYQTMKGRGALKSVLRAYGNTSFEEMNQITRHIPDEAKISEELQSMKDSHDGDSSIILYTLENEREQYKGFVKKQPDKLNGLYEWCHINDNGELVGPLNKRFAQAIRLEGTKVSSSKHPAGVIVSPHPLSEVCPMVYDSKEDSLICGFEMNDMEAIGLVKLDILGIAMLDRVMGIRNILQTGDIE